MYRQFLVSILTERKLMTHIQTIPNIRFSDIRLSILVKYAGATGNISTEDYSFCIKSFALNCLIVLTMAAKICNCVYF